MPDPCLRVKFIAAWTALAALKLALAAVLPPFGDEAFYWWEGRHLAWAYSDLPGASAWLARLGVEVGGQSGFGLRWPFLLLGLAVPWLLVRIARRWFGEDAGWRAGLLGLLFPLTAALGPLAVPDVPLTVAVLLALDAAAALLQRYAPIPLLELALGLALGAFSHYRFAPVIAAGALGLLLSRPGRVLARRPGLWLALATGAAAWAPVLGWNLAHHSAGLSFQFVERHPWAFSPEGAWFPLIQAGLATPLLFALLAMGLGAAWRGWRTEPAGDGRWGLILGGAGALWLGYFVLGFFADRERVSFHWALPAYLPVLAVLAARWPEHRPWLRRAAAGLGVIGQAVLLGWLLAATVPDWRTRLAEGKAYPETFAGWREIAAAARRALAEMPADTALVADDFMLGAELAFALHPRPVVTLAHPHDAKHGRAVQLDLWGLRHAQLPSWPALLVVEDSLRRPRDRLAGYHALCAQTGPLPSPEVLNLDHGRKRFLVYRLYVPPRPDAACIAPAMSWIDAPAAGARVGREFAVAGWAFKDGAGIARVEVLLDGWPLAEAGYGLPMPHVAEFWRISTDPAHPRVGFRAEVELPAAIAHGAHRLGLRLYGRDGSVEDSPTQPVRVQP